MIVSENALCLIIFLLSNMDCLWIMSIVVIVRCLYVCLCVCVGREARVAGVRQYDTSYRPFMQTILQLACMVEVCILNPPYKHLFRVMGDL